MLMLYMVMEDAELQRPLARYFDGLQHRLTETIGDAMRVGALPATTNAADLAALLIATIQGGYVLSRVLSDPHKLEQATGAARALLMIASDQLHKR